MIIVCAPRRKYSPCNLFLSHSSTSPSMLSSTLLILSPPPPPFPPPQTSPFHLVRLFLILSLQHVFLFHLVNTGPSTSSTPCTPPSPLPRREHNPSTTTSPSTQYCCVLHPGVCYLYSVFDGLIVICWWK